MKKLILLFSSLSIFFSLSAQSDYVSFNINAFQPIAGMNKNVETLPVGVSMGYYKSMEKSPLSFGVESGIASYNCDTYMMDYKGETIRVTEEDCFFTFHGSIRYDLIDFKSSKLYGEGKIGATVFFSTIMPTECNGDTDFEGKTTAHGTAFNLGFGGGFMFNPTLFANYDEDCRYWIDLNVTSNGGTNSSYSIDRDEGTDLSNRTTASSFTSYMDYKIGLIIKL